MCVEDHEMAGSFSNRGRIQTRGKIYPWAVTWGQIVLISEGLSAEAILDDK